MRQRYDVIVVGGGIVGLTAATAFGSAGLATAIVEAGPAVAPAAKPVPVPSASSPAGVGSVAAGLDLRVYALSPASLALLSRLGVADALLKRAHQPWRQMQVLDAAGGTGLTFRADEIGADALGIIIEQASLAEALDARLATLPNVARIYDCRVEDLVQEADAVTVQTSDLWLAAQLVVATDGRDSKVRSAAGIGVEQKSYGQRAIVAWLRPERSDSAVAWQRFTPTGPIALLPWRDGLVSLVWTLPAAQAESLQATGEDRFCDALQRATGGAFGRFELLSGRASFPLQRLLAETFAGHRVALAGDAAHVVHPLAGQGLNLGLGDVNRLLHCWPTEGGPVTDASAAAALARYSRERRFETAIALGLYDILNRFFSNDALAATLLRGPGLSIVNRLGPVRRQLVRAAASSGVLAA